MTRWSLGVDLGTSFTSGAVATADRVEVLEVAGERRIPSTVLLDGSGKLLAGGVAQRMVGRSPDRAERNPKRYVGRRPMVLGGELITAQQALGALLGQYVDAARARFDGSAPSVLVLTHPVAWSEAQRTVLGEVAELVLPGVPVELVAEPVAAAVHYGATYGHPRSGDGQDSVAVYDLGGGTFDTAVLSFTESGFTVVGAPAGDPEISGETFDERVFHHFGEQLSALNPQWWEQVSTSGDRRWLAAATDLLTDARLAKESLSEHDDAGQYVVGADADVRITRPEFEALIADDVARTTALLAKSLAESGRSPEQLRGVFLTGGASRIRLVEETLRASYNDLVRTVHDPKAVVSLGAARWAQRSLKPAPPTPVSDPGVGEKTQVVRIPSPNGPFPVLATGVLEAVAANGVLYTWGVGEGGGHRVRLLDGNGRVERELPMARIVGWAVAEHLVLIAERRGTAVRVHALSPDLIILNTVDLLTPHDPWLIAQAGTGWVFLRGTSTRPVNNADGLPWGELADPAFLVVRPTTAFTPVTAQPTPLGPTATWFINEDGTRRRLLDPSMPSSVPPTPLGDGRSCALILGRTSRRRTGLRSRAIVPSQTLATLDATGELSVVAEQQDTTGLWAHQLLYKDNWFLATNLGLETFEGTDRRLFVERPPAGTARWIATATHLYGLVQDSLIPNRGLSLHLYDETRPRVLGTFPGLLGNLASVVPTESPRIRVDGDRIWLATRTSENASQVLLVDGDRVEKVTTAPGWLEPLGQGYALHTPKPPPGDDRTTPTALVRLPG
ncbi:Hsp70 family protein [Actinokineospora auranticolor]|uniref:Hsp70 protein n=1 Tax=Actinokineospora auranticolor TaxID=155976 RepID=A0A2S6GML3_9PSEU|nr:Hsp70 family protein [Actinokineospora auranticolor]PPK66420.1 Hsp70 protein [Actinokineospora auranticolor]